MVALVFWSNNRPVSVAIPTEVMPRPNGYDDLVRAGAMAKAVRHKSPYSMAQPDYTYGGFEAAARDAQPALALMRQALAKEYRCPPVRSYGAKGPFPAFASFRELARTEMGVATYYEMSGRPAQATEARLDGLELGLTVPRGGSLIAGLVGIACEAIALSQIEPQLPLLSERELAHVAERLADISARRVSLADILQEEGYSDAASEVEIVNDPKGRGSFDAIRGLLEENDPTMFTTGKKKPINLKQNWEVLQFLLADKAAIVRDNMAYSRALVAEARKPFGRRIAPRLPNNLLARLRGDIAEQAGSKFAGMEAAVAIVRAEVALLRYKKAHGRYPETLSSLTPAYLGPADIIDPCGGAPLKYRPLNGGKDILLYSIGTDLKDDGGAPSRYVGVGTGDIVAGRMWIRRAFKK